MYDHLYNKQMCIFRVNVGIDILMHCILCLLHPTKTSIHTNRDGVKFMYKRKSIASTGSYTQNHSNDKWNTNIIQNDSDALLQQNVGWQWRCLGAFPFRSLGALEYYVTLTLEHLHSNRLVHMCATAMCGM